MGTPGPQEAERPTSFWDLLPYLAHWASLPLFCFRPPSPCPRAAAMPYGAEARLLRCCWCLLVNVDTLAYTVPGQLVPGHHWPSQVLAPATRLACSFVLTTDLVQQAKFWTTSARCARPPTMCGALCAVFSTPLCTSARCGPLRSCLRWHAQLLPVQSAPCPLLIHHAVWPLVHDADALSGPSHPFVQHATFSLCFLSSHRNLRPAADNVD